MSYTPWDTKRTNHYTDPKLLAIPGQASYNLTSSLEPSGGLRLHSTRSNVGEAMRHIAGGFQGVAWGVQPGEYVRASLTMEVLGAFADDSRPAQRTISLRTEPNAGTAVSSPTPNVAGVYRMTVTMQMPTSARTGLMLQVNHDGTSTDPDIIISDVLVERFTEDPVDVPADFFSGDTINPNPLERYIWSGVANSSTSVYQARTVAVGNGSVPVKAVATDEALYGDRVTSYRWEVLEHASGIDRLVGVLDGVSDGSLTWTQNAAVKGSGKVQVVDLDVAQPGMLRISDLALASVRVRPVCVIQGLPENPLGVFLMSAADEQWEATGRVWSIELLDRCTVPSQDVVDQSYAVPAGALILQTVRAILASSNEYIAINEASALATSSGMVWEAGTSKLKIINDLLDVAGYNALWMDGYGNFQVTPRVLPANRSIQYEVLGIARELRDGAQSIYMSDWTRSRDSFEVPNKVIAVEAAGGDDVAALIGQWTNTDASSPYSYAARGRWIPHVLDSVECPAGTPAETVTFLQNRARTTLVQMSAVQAQVKVSHLPIPVRVSDVLRFSHDKAGVDARHVITRIQLDTSPLGLMSSTLQEVISL